MDITNYSIWSVVWNIFYFPQYMGCHPSYWRTHIFSRWFFNHQPDSIHGVYKPTFTKNGAPPDPRNFASNAFRRSPPRPWNRRSLRRGSAARRWRRRRRWKAHSWTRRGWKWRRCSLAKADFRKGFPWYFRNSICKWLMKICVYIYIYTYWGIGYWGWYV